MEKGSKGDLNVRFKSYYNDEIGQLGNSFNTMMSNINNLIKKLEEEQLKKTQAEMRALMAQINPHFLYNTLASIYWALMGTGNEKVAKMVASLSNYYRLGLNKGKGFIKIDKEIEHVKEYLYIQKIRYGDKFDYSIEADSDVYKYKTINMIIQPLVENSLLHVLRAP